MEAEAPAPASNEVSSEPVVQFKSLGLVDVLCEACKELSWDKPTRIQEEAIPIVLKGQDLIGLAETGSGKTGAFALPILQRLLNNPQRLFALVLTPTRELAIQISEQFEALGTSIGVKVAVIVGGIDMMTQAMALAKRPHVIVGTPGRLVDHLENTKGFNLKSLKFLVMDEADRILNLDFEAEIDKILRVIPKERQTMLLSATMTQKVAKLQRASLQNPAKVEVSSKYQTVESLQQFYIFIPQKHKELYLVYLLNELAGNSFILFCGTCIGAMSTALMLRNLGLMAVPLHGQMSQAKRLGSLNKFRAKSRAILVATDVASRGLDIPHVDVVINYDVPTHSKDYIHRVGRTARAGRAGMSITFVTQVYKLDACDAPVHACFLFYFGYDVELFQRVEQLIRKKLPLYSTEANEVMILSERVQEAQRIAKQELKELNDKRRKGKRKKGDMSDEGEEEDQTSYKKSLKTKSKRRKP